MTHHHHPEHPVLSRLLAANTQWAVDVDQREPEFFKQLAKGQSPKVLWIGCSDSRVPETVITACKPGDIFVHRNIANQFHLDDDSAQSVLSYAVDSLGVEHVIVVGHTQCGGANYCLQAASSPPSTTAPTPDTPLTRWLAPLTSLATSLQNRRPNTNPDAAPSVSETLRILVDENVKAQVANVCTTGPVTAAWQGSKPLWVHGWVYEIENGRLRDLGISKGREA